MAVQRGEGDRVLGSPWRTLGVLSCLGLVTLFGETMLLPAIPDMIRQFGITYDTSSWILSAYLISASVMTPVAGKLSDTYGKKRVLLAILGVYCAGVLAGGFSQTIEVMVVARLAMGSGVAMFPIAFAIIRDVLPEERLAIGQTIFGSTFFAGAIVGLLVGASIIEDYGWHFTFFSIFPLAVLLALLISRAIHEERRGAPRLEGGTGGEAGPAPARFDARGTIALAATMVFSLGGLTLLEGGVSDEGEVVGLLALSVLSLALLFFLEHRSAHPLLDFGLLNHGILLPSTIILVLVGFCTLVVYQTVPILVESPAPLGFGGDPVAVAHVQLPFMAALLAGTVGSGFILNRMGNLSMTSAGTLLSAAGFLSLLAFHSTEVAVGADLAVIGVGLSFAFTGGFNVVLVSAPLESTGIVLGMTLLLVLVGQSVGPAVAAGFQQLYQGTVPGYQGSYPLPASYDLIFLSAAAVSVASVVLSLLLILRRKRILGGPPPGEGGAQRQEAPNQ